MFTTPGGLTRERGSEIEVRVYAMDGRTETAQVQFSPPQRPTLAPSAAQSPFPVVFAISSDCSGAAKRAIHKTHSHERIIAANQRILLRRRRWHTASDSSSPSKIWRMSKGGAGLQPALDITPK